MEKLIEMFKNQVEMLQTGDLEIINCMTFGSYLTSFHPIIAKQFNEVLHKGYTYLVNN